MLEEGRGVRAGLAADVSGGVWPAQRCLPSARAIFAALLCFPWAIAIVHAKPTQLVPQRPGLPDELLELNGMARGSTSGVTNWKR